MKLLNYLQKPRIDRRAEMQLRQYHNWRLEADEYCAHMSDHQKHEWALFNVRNHPSMETSFPVRLLVEATIGLILLLIAATGHCQIITPTVSDTKIISPVDGSGNVKVDCITGCTGGGGGGNAAAGPTGSAVPGDADYLGFNVSGNLTGISASNPLPITSLQLPASLDTNGYLKIHEQGTASVNVTNGSIAVTGTFWQPTQPVSWTSQSVSLTGSWPYSGALGSVSVSNFPSTQPVSWSGQSVSLSGSWPYSGALGSVSVSNFPSTQAVSGSVSISNFPSTQPVSGTVGVSSLPTGPANSANSTPVVIATDQKVTVQGSVNVANLPTTLAGALKNELTTGGSPYDARQIRALNVNTDTVNVGSGTVTANQGGAPWADNITQIGGSALALGATTPQQSIPVVIDNLATQPIVVSVNGTPTVKLSNGPLNPLYVNNQPLLYAIINGVLTPVLLVQGQAPMAQSLPVTIASNQSAVPASQSGTWAVTAQAVPSGAPMPATPAPVSLSTNGALIVTSAPSGLPLPPCNPVRTTNCQHF